MGKRAKVFLAIFIPLLLIVIAANVGNVYNAHVEVDEANANADKVFTECMQTEGYYQCLSYCDQPIVKNPEDCRDRMDRIRGELSL